MLPTKVTFYFSLHSNANKRNHIKPHAPLNIYCLCVEAVSMGGSAHFGMALSQSLQVAGCPLTRSASPGTNGVTQLCSMCLLSSSQRQCVFMAIAGEWKVVETHRPLRSRVGTEKPLLPMDFIGWKKSEGQSDSRTKRFHL